VNAVSVMTNGSGKGDRYRPVDQKKYDEGWEKAFGKGSVPDIIKKPKKKPTKKKKEV